MNGKKLKLKEKTNVIKNRKRKPDESDSSHRRRIHSFKLSLPETEKENFGSLLKLVFFSFNLNLITF